LGLADNDALLNCPLVASPGPLCVIMKNWNKIIPYISLGLASVALYILLKSTTDVNFQNILLGLFSSSVYFFIAYLFYDLVRQVIIKKEKKYLTDYIKNKISNDIFVSLYFLKKIIHGYNLETNKLDYILNQVNYTKSELDNAIKNQSYLGFQIFKNTDEVRSMFSDAINDNLILKYSSHIDSISILRISNNLAKLEIILKNDNNFEKCAETGIEFKTVNGKEINPLNDEKYLLLKKTAIEDRFVVYDSGFFDKDIIEKLLNRYVLKQEASKKVSTLLYETFSLMKYWLPDIVQISRNENRFRIIKDFFSPSTNTQTKKSKIFVADIVDTK
jgi:hypothetical protein